MYHELKRATEANDIDEVLAIVARDLDELDAALRVACGCAHYELTDLLLRMGASPNAADRWSERTALHEAAEKFKALGAAYDLEIAQTVLDQIEFDSSQRLSGGQ